MGAGKVASKRCCEGEKGEKVKNRVRSELGRVRHAPARLGEVAGATRRADTRSPRAVRPRLAGGAEAGPDTKFVRMPAWQVMQPPTLPVRVCAVGANRPRSQGTQLRLLLAYSPGLQSWHEERSFEESFPVWRARGQEGKPRSEYQQRGGQA